MGNTASLLEPNHAGTIYPYVLENGKIERKIENGKLTYKQVGAILKIETDEWPISSLRSYIRLQKELNYALDGVRETLRQQIRTAYNETFTYLENVAKEQNVPVSVLSNKDNTILSRTTPTNILVLRGNISTDAFYQAEIEKILDYANRHQPVPPQPEKDKEEPGKEQPAPPKRKRVRQASLQTKTQLPISTEEDNSEGRINTVFSVGFCGYFPCLIPL